MSIIFSLILLFLTCACNATQYEEGWRWRESFYDLGEVMDGESTHKMLSDHEHDLTLQLVDESSKNVDLAAIGLVYEVRKSGQQVQYGYQEDLIRHVEDNGKLGVPCAFVSGYQTRATGNSFRSGNANQTSLGESFYIINGDYFRHDEWKANLETYFHQEKTSSLKIIGEDVTNHINNQFHDEDNFAQNFAHAEQWILQYLNSYDKEDPYVFRAQINNILGKIIKKESVSKDQIEIIRVVLHVHTNRDACARCAPTMSIFSRTLNDLLQETTKKHAYNMPLILVSSRTNYQERRFLAGHDNFYHKHFNARSQQKPVSSYYKAFVNSPVNYADNVLK